MSNKQIRILTYALMCVGLAVGSYYTYYNVYHYEVKVVEKEEDKDDHEGHDHDPIPTEAEQFVTAAELDTNNAELQLRAGRSLHIQGDVRQALPFYERYERTNELSADVASEIGTLYWKLHKGLNAVKYFSKALRTDSNHVNSLYGLGIVSMTIGETPIAEKYFTKVIALEPEGELSENAKGLIEKLKNKN